MADAKGEGKDPTLRPTFDRRIKLEFHGVRIFSDGGLLAYRELDDVPEGLGSQTDEEIALFRSEDGSRRRHIDCHQLNGVAALLSSDSRLARPMSYVIGAA